MVLQALFFYLFAAIMIAAAVMVVSSRNPVHSVLFLILTFFNAAALFLMSGAEFLALILVVVYVGAVAVLFLFVVMMLDIDFAELRSGVMEYAPVGALIGVVLAVELIVVLAGNAFTVKPEVNPAQPIPNLTETSNIKALGDILYTDYAYLFQIAGMLLLVAMIGAIVLTLRHKENVKRQNIAKQVARNRQTAIDVVKVKPGQGA
jgi:NADH-quinone oxidoreductase subunit J